MPSTCPVCGRFYCDHTPEERGQTVEEMMREPTEEEYELWRNHPHGCDERIELGKRLAHLPVEKK